MTRWRRGNALQTAFRTVAVVACVLVLQACAAGGAHAQATAAPAAPAAARAERLMAVVRELSSEPYQGRAVATPGNAAARAWIRARFEAAGLEPAAGGSWEQPFTFTPEGPASTPEGLGSNGAARRAVEGVNLVGRCSGREPDGPALVVSAHYDHVGVRNGRMYPGADDNASGVAVLLELAAACAATPFRHDVLFVAFDAEESGLQGARAFVSRPPVPKDRLALNINLDMVARGDTGELFAAGLHHYPGLRPALQPVADRAPITLRFGHDVPGTGADDWTGQSDHGAFHAAGIPFVYFGVEDHPDYHQPTDTADKIDPVFFARAAGVVLDALHALDRHVR